ncbi:hypothetical protein CU098_000628, partial [Rhizopus stolonifer]
GRWNYEEWEYPPTLSAGTGVELWAWLRDTQDIDDQWKSLTNTLSGLFCASLNFIDETITTEPRLLFQSEEMRHEQLRYGSLPHENVCTENLTPWIKLLPCKSKSGISNDACTERQLELKQTVTSVMDPIRDSSRRDWSLASVFDRQLRQACPVANQSRVSVDLTNAGDEYELKPAGQKQGNAVTYHLSKEPLDIRMDWRQSSFDYPLEPVQPIIYAERYFTGYGQEHGGLKVTIHNRNQLEAMPVIYYDSLP